MPFKKLSDKQKYNTSYYQKNRERLLEYRKLRREKDRQLWKEWNIRKKNKERKERINKGQIYTSKSVFRKKSPYT